ncbi:unnamed protein product [Nippostrongylus brasiliensis]|uniref:Transposase n=1 Tax=Nippostrongylus brasiliensis TaxID=27835 RepID=A0A0N4XWR8_NIPBR|nr:unnamed protein product [Nippostrongylus brasiliensis]
MKLHIWTMPRADHGDDVCIYDDRTPPLVGRKWGISRHRVWVSYGVSQLLQMTVSDFQGLQSYSAISPWFGERKRA